MLQLTSYLQICLGFAFTASLTFASPVSGQTRAAAPSSRPEFYSWAQTPPMGWNSYDAYGDTVTEAEVLANAEYMKAKLLPSGYRYVVIDFRWYDPDPLVTIFA